MLFIFYFFLEIEIPSVISHRHTLCDITYRQTEIPSVISDIPSVISHADMQKYPVI